MRNFNLDTYLKVRNIPKASLEANSIMEGIEWADEHPDSKHTYTKQQLIDIGFVFTTNGDIVTPDQLNEALKNYLKYQKQKFIEQAKEWLKKNMYIEHIFEYSEDKEPVQYVCASASDSVDEFVNNFCKAMEE